MKRIFLSLLSVLYAWSLSAQAYTGPYLVFESLMDDRASFDTWTVEGPDEEFTWRFNEAEKCVTLYNNPVEPTPNRLCSPVFELDQEGRYVLYIGFVMLYKPYMKAYIEDVESGEKNEFKVFHSSFSDNVESYTNEHVHVEHPGKKRLVFELTETTGNARVSLRNIQLAFQPVSDFAAVRGARNTVHQKNITVPIQFFLNNVGYFSSSRFTVTSTVDGGEPVTQEFNQNIIGDQIITLAHEVEFTDYGSRDICVIVKGDDDYSEDNDTLRYTLSNTPAAEYPCILDFEQDNTLFHTYNADPSTPGWQVFNDYYNGWALQYYAPGNPTPYADDWFFTPALDFATGSDFYQVAFEYYNPKYSFEVCYGEAPTPEAMTHVIKSYDDVYNWENKLDSLLFQPVIPRGYVGFHLKAENVYKVIFDNIKVGPVDAVADDISVSNLKGRNNNYALIGERHYCTYDLNNLSMTQQFTDLDLSYELDGKEFQNSFFIRVAPRETKHVPLEEKFEEAEPGFHTLTIRNLSDFGQKTDNNSVSVPLVLVSDKDRYKRYEFATPESLDSMTMFNFTNKETGTDAAPSWYYHEYPAENNDEPPFPCINSSTSETDELTDHWLILPPVHVDEGLAVLGWKAYTFEGPGISRSDDSRYQVLISTADSAFYNFEVVHSTSADFKCYNNFASVDLSSYAGKNIYVAFRHFPGISNVLGLRDVTYYGSFSDVQSQPETGIRETAAADKSLLFQEDRIVCASPAESIDVYDVQGRRVLSARHTSTCSVATLPVGAYVVKAQMDGQIKIRKFIR